MFDIIEGFKNLILSVGLNIYREEYSKVLKRMERKGINPKAITVPIVGHLSDVTATDYDKIYIGFSCRLDGIERSQYVLLHESIHVLFGKYPPSKSELKVFGSPKQWKAKFQINDDSYEYDKNKYVSWYATTHPEEDWVETTIKVIFNEKTFSPPTNKKKNVIERWWNRVGLLTYKQCDL